MEVVAKWYWRVIVTLFAAFVILCLLRVTVLPKIPAAWPLTSVVVAYAMLLVACGLDELLLLWIAHADRMKALCVGFSLKLFDWRLGDLSHLRRPGGALIALGPLRLAWRVSP
jgi:hypothetical protein